MSATTDYDVLICGAGPVGLALALALSRSTSLRIGLIDTTPAAQLKANATRSAHYLALSYGTRMVYENIQLWSALRAHCAAIDGVHISKRGNFGALRMEAGDIDVPNLGYVIESQVLEQQLIEQLAAEQITPLRHGVVDLSQSTQSVHLTVQSGKQTTTLNSKLLFAADGKNSPIRQLAGIRHTEYNYQQTALSVPIQLQQSHKHIAYERVAPAGAIALLPLRDERQCIMLLSVENSQAAQLQALSQDALGTYLQAQFGYLVGQLTPIGPTQPYPLKRSFAHRSHLGRVLLIGDARQHLHPIFAQGFNLAMRDLETICQALQADATAHEDPTHLAQQLTPHTRHSDTLHHTLGTITHTLANWFNNPSRFNRTSVAGLALFDLLPPLHNELAYFGAGLNNREPRSNRSAEQAANRHEDT